MRNLIFLTLLIASIVCEKQAHSELTENSSKSIARGIFPTRLDHFRTNDQSKISFFYYVNSQYFRNNGPIYLYIKDFGDLSTRWIEEGLMVDIAKETGAALLTFNHRYFGDNIPTESASLANLEFLTVQQMLADIANLLNIVRLFPDSNVVVWGSGFGASLAVYARQRYPHLVTAAWASSGVFEMTISNFVQYDMMEVLLYTDFGCDDIIHDAFEEIANLINDHNAINLQNTLDLCHPIDTYNQKDIYAFFESHYNIIMSYMREFHLVGTQSLCNELIAVEGLDPINQLARWLNNVIHQGICFDHTYDGLIERASNTSWYQIGTNVGTRQSYYLLCTQIGQYLLADSVSWLPNIPLTYHFEKCQDIFGQDTEILQLENRALTVLYGETRYQHVHDVIYTSGLHDPWYFTGNVETVESTSSAIAIESAGKSADLTSESPQDSEFIADAKRQVIEHVTKYY